MRVGKQKGSVTHKPTKELTFRLELYLQMRLFTQLLGYMTELEKEQSSSHNQKPGFYFGNVLSVSPYFINLVIILGRAQYFFFNLT